ncbi:MAG TPA: hypothetical protein VHE99_06390 [Gammaproteobacteria bacterium]|nr:hypothetical protein [Gammaproteobacteria bacterium]
MKGLKESIKTPQKVSITPKELLAEQNYRGEALVASSKLFEKMAAEMTDTIKKSPEVNILVLAAGSFPSYQPFLAKILQTLPQVKKINFTLVDPMKAATDLFMEEFYLQETKALFSETKKFKPKISIVHAQQTIGDFLKEKVKDKFHIIYLEHPEVSAAITLFSALGFFKHQGDWASELPRLSSVLHADAIVVAAVKTFEEQMQIERILRFSFESKPKALLDYKQLVGAPHRLLIPKDFYSGVICRVLNPISDPQKIDNKVDLANFSKLQLLMVMGMACIAYVGTFSSFKENTACALLGTMQLLTYDPDASKLSNLGTKVLIGLLQAGLCFKVAMDDLSVGHNRP